MKHSTTPILAERVFGMRLTDEGAWLTSTAADHTYEGPVFHDPHPPYTADEWEWIKSLDISYVRERNFSGLGTVVSEQVHVEPSPLALMQMVHHLGGKRTERFLDHPSIHQGIHAFRPGAVPERYEGYAVRAEVDLFGRVVEYERGYRAEKMRMRSLRVVHPPERSLDGLLAALDWSIGAGPPLSTPFTNEEIRASLADRYQCEVSVEIDEPEPAPEPRTYFTGTHLNARCMIAPQPIIKPKRATWQTSEENSKSTKSNWMKRTLHLLRHPLKSLREWRRARKRKSASQLAAEELKEALDKYANQVMQGRRP